MAAMTAGAAAGPAGQVSIYDAPPLAHAKYVAKLALGYDANGPAYVFSIERGMYQCLALFSAVAGRYPDPGPIAAGQKTCDLSLAVGLRRAFHHTDNEQILVIGSDGTRYTERGDIQKPAVPVDTPAKALLVVWLDYASHSLAWWNGSAFVGGPEDGHVTKVDGGYEVETSEEDDSHCGKKTPTHTITQYQRIVLVTTAGELTETSKTKVHAAKQPCVAKGGAK